MRKRFAVIGLVLGFAVAAMPMAALAVDPPDAPGLSIDAANAYRNVLQTGDMVSVILYNIPYATNPDDNANVNFLLQLKTSGGTVIGNNVPYPYNDGGYNRGIMSIYLTAAEVTAASLGSWPYTGLTLTLAGNPLVFATQPSDTWTLTTSDFSTSADSAVNATQLCQKVISHLAVLQTSWGLDLLGDTGLINSTDGSGYLGGSAAAGSAIPNLRAMAPACFSITSQELVIPTPVGTPTGGGVLDPNRFAGTFWLTPAFNSVNDDLGWPHGLFQGLLVALAIAGSTSLGWAIGSRTGNGTVGALVAFFGSNIALIPTTMGMGWLDVSWGLMIMAVEGVVAVVAVVVRNLR